MEGSREGLAVPCRPAKPPAELPSHLLPTDPAPPVSPQIPSGNLGMFGSSGAAQARTMQQPPQPPVQPLSSSQPSLRAQVPPFLSPQVGPIAARADAGAPMAGGIGAMGTSLVMRASSPPLARSSQPVRRGHLQDGPWSGSVSAAHREQVPGGKAMPPTLQWCGFCPGLRIIQVNPMTCPSWERNVTRRNIA